MSKVKTVMFEDVCHGYRPKLWTTLRWCILKCEMISVLQYLVPTIGVLICMCCRIVAENITYDQAGIVQ